MVGRIGYIAFLLPILAVNRWRLPKAERTPFHWRWSIPLIGVFLVLADFLYFNALIYEDSLISIISSLRRGGVVISFVVGVVVFHEKNLRKKRIVSGWNINRYFANFAGKPLRKEFQVSGFKFKV